MFRIVAKTLLHSSLYRRFPAEILSQSAEGIKIAKFVAELIDLSPDELIKENQIRPLDELELLADLQEIVAPKVNEDAPIPAGFNITLESFAIDSKEMVADHSPNPASDEVPAKR